MTRILVIGNETNLAAALTAHGAVVDEASDAAQARELADSTAYRLVLLDLPLGESDGVGLLRRLVAARPERPVIVLCGFRERATRARCLDLGAADCIAMPIPTHELVARIRPALVGVRDEAVLRAGPLTLDLRRRAVYIGDERIALTSREFGVLRHLMLQHDEVCTRMELLSEVWGYSFDPGTNVVDVCIRRLRAKVGSGTIETVRSVGYAFQSVAEPALAG